jgi:hypothetical protein
VIDSRSYAWGAVAFSHAAKMRVVCVAVLRTENLARVIFYLK